jgi:hypothetical protein
MTSFNGVTQADWDVGLGVDEHVLLLVLNHTRTPQHVTAAV